MNNRNKFYDQKNNAQHRQINHAARNLIQHVLQGHKNVGQQKNFDNRIQQPD